MGFDTLPSVAACMPHRNYFKYLPETLESLVKQSYTIRDIVIIDDGSDDGSWEKLKGLADNWPVKTPALTIRRVENNPMEERSQRIPYIRNEAFKALPGKCPDYVFFPDADDLWAEDYVKACLDIMENDEEIDIVYPNVILFQEGKITRRNTVPEFNQERLFRQCYITCCSMMRTEAFLHAGMWPTKFFKKEYVFWNTITRIGHKAKKLPGNYFFYKQHAGQRHTQYDNNGGGRINKAERYNARRYIAERFGLMYE
jgi:glycosyltransferase involved in cell wall biosynthesis